LARFGLASGGALDQFLCVRLRHGVHSPASLTITFPNAGKGYRTGRDFLWSRDLPLGIIPVQARKFEKKPGNAKFGTAKKQIEQFCEPGSTIIALEVNL
jgi:hypothetical protein